MTRLTRPVVIFGFAFALVAAWLAVTLIGANTTGPLAGFVDRLSTFTTIFLGIFIEAAPFLLLGTLGSGLVEVFFNKDDLNRLIPRTPLAGAIVGGLMGLFFPVCECGVVPLTRRLFKKGLPLSVGVSFLLAAPVMNPIVIASTLAAFGVGPVLFLRLGLTLLIAVITGLVFARQTHPERLLNATAWAEISGGSIDSPPLSAKQTGEGPGVGIFARPSLREGLPRVLTIAADEFFEMGRYLIIGSLLASFMQTVVPQSALLAVSSGPVISVLAMITLAVILSVCSTVDAFIALAFAGTFTTGSVLAFLVFGPMVDLKSTIMFLRVFNRKAVVYLILLPLAMTILFSVFINLNTTW
ncbi:MAG TPA: permease [Anaerolineales bacterium]|nr:permease [Anaerolineales bacterium]